MYKPTCPDELVNDIVITDLTVPESQCPDSEQPAEATSVSVVPSSGFIFDSAADQQAEAANICAVPSTSSGSNSNLDLGFQRGLNLGKKYLQGSVKTSTLNQVMANIYLPYSQSEMFEIVVSILVFILLTFNY